MTIHPLQQQFKKNSWRALLSALLLLLILYPYAEPRESTWILRLLNDLILLTIIFTAALRLSRILIGLVLIAPAIVYEWVPATAATQLVIIISSSLLYIYTIALTGRFIMRAQAIRLNEVCASLSLYLLIGLAWMTFYLFLEELTPGSFLVKESHVTGWADLLYYSFVTLTTLGYGDIVPTTSWARSLAIIEAIAGILFIPVMISSSLSLYLADKRQGPSRQ